MKRALAALSLLLLSNAVFAEDAFTPAILKQNINIDQNTNPTGFATQTSYITGVINSIITVQNATNVGRFVCLPQDLTVQNVKDALTAQDISTFANTNQGGVIYIFSAMLAKYPCPK